MRNCTIKTITLLTHRNVLLAALLVLAALLSASFSFAAEVLIVGDVQYKPVSDVAQGIKRSLQSSSKIYEFSSLRGKLASVVSREDASVVVALGKDAVDEAIRLPSSVAVIYGLIIAPPKKHRQNMSGVYMSTPVIEYLDVIRKYLPSIKKISVIGSPELLTLLKASGHASVTSHRVNSSTDILNALKRAGDCQGLLILPDVSMLSASVMENLYLFSYRRSIPLFGISEGNVKQGSLMALVFDPAVMSRQLAEMAESAIRNAGADNIEPASPGRYRLSLNVNTARKMGISISDSLIRNADKIYD